MEDKLQLTDLFAVCKLTNDIIILVKKEDAGKSGIMAVKVLRKSRTYSIGELDRFLKFGAFEPIITEDRPGQKFYRSLVYRSLPEATLSSMLEEFESAKIIKEEEDGR